MQLSTRRAGIDMLRIVGVVAVIAGHTWAGPWAWQWLYPWHVPVFFVLSGWLMHNRRPLSIELRARVRSLVPPTITWWILIAGVWLLAEFITHGEPNFAQLERAALGGSYAQGMFGTFWFVSALFLATLVARIVLAARWSMLTKLAIAIAALALATIFGEWASFAVWTLILGPLYAGWVLLGQLAKQLFEMWKPHPVIATLIGLALVGGSFWLVGEFDPERLDLKNGVLGVPALGVVLALALSIGAIVVVEWVPVPKGLGTWMSLLAKPSIAVVLAHPLVLYLTAALPEWAQFVFAIVLPWAFAFALMPTVFSPFIVGARPTSTPWRQVKKRNITGGTTTGSSPSAQ